ncbi:MAG: tetratricopeptide repeat protein [Deltaproteobacteria bacterium]|nr:MAG: tetratricopeptide repeat protein [Deltaproteobacteria bacterium]
MRFNLSVVPPRDREALEQAVVRGSELLKQGKIDQAQLAFRGALVLEPDNPRVLALLALSYFRSNAFAEARAIYEQLVERAPTDASHRLNLGLVHLKLNDPERAIAALETSRALDPSQGRAVSYLGLAYARAGRYAEAYRAFLLAGQNDLATEIESNLSAAERERIHAQLGRSPHGPWPDRAAPAAAPADPAAPATTASISGRIPTPTGVRISASTLGAPRTSTPPEVARTPTPHIIPRTRPPVAPPARSRPPSHQEAEAPAHEAERASAEPPPAPGSGERVPEPSAAPEPLRPSAPAGIGETAAPRPPGEARISHSMQFVLPRADPAAPRRPLDGSSMISYAVASAMPSPATAPRTRSGGAPPRPLSELATDELVRPEDGDDAFELGPSGTRRPVLRAGDPAVARPPHRRAVRSRRLAASRDHRARLPDRRPGQAQLRRGQPRRRHPLPPRRPRVRVRVHLALGERQCPRPARQATDRPVPRRRRGGAAARPTPGAGQAARAGHGVRRCRSARRLDRARDPARRGPAGRRAARRDVRRVHRRGYRAGRARRRRRRSGPDRGPPSDQRWRCRRARGSIRTGAGADRGRQRRAGRAAHRLAR